MTIVVDASVAVKWLIEEPFADNAEALRKDAERADQYVVAPPLLPAEVTNAIYQQLRRREITEQQAGWAVAQIALFPVDIISDALLHEEAYAFARLHRLGSVYDSQYIVLARKLDAELWTDDQRLLNSISHAAPWVQWIGDYPVPGATTP
ncbi:MAG: type II toxin-antitoxin system VapC family toxin [Thermomicrobiales bacterium]